MKSIRKLIKEILNEVQGNQKSVEKHSEYIAKDVSEKIHRDFNKINDGGIWEMISQVYSSEEARNDTKINLITVYFNFSLAKQENITGVFKSNQTTLLDNGFYNVVIELEIYVNNLDGLERKLDPIIAHELNHAFVHIKQINKENKHKYISQARNKTKGQISYILNRNAPLKNFMEMIYLSNPMEIQARVQQSAANLKYIKSNNHNETINALFQFTPLNDAKKLINYKLEGIDQVNSEDVKLFIDRFNENLRNASKDAKIINEPEKFFEYWHKYMYDTGEILYRKILKLVASKHNINEGVFDDEMDEDLYKKMYWRFNHLI